MNEGKLKRWFEQGYVEEVLWKRVYWIGVANKVCWRGYKQGYVEEVEVLWKRVCWRGVANKGKLKKTYEWYERGYVEEVVWMGWVEEVLQMRVSSRGVVNGVSLRGVMNGSKVECHPWDSYRESQINELCNWICNKASAIMMVYVMVICITVKSSMCIPNTAVLENML